MAKRDQRGFSVVEVLLVLLVLALVGTAIGYVMINKKDGDNSKTAETTKNQTAAKAGQSEITEKSYLRVKEWGVKFELPDDAKGAQYSFAKDQPGTIFLTSTALFNTFPECTEVSSVTQTTVDDYKKLIGDNLGGLMQPVDQLVHFGDKDYYAAASNGSCLMGQQPSQGLIDEQSAIRKLGNPDNRFVKTISKL